MLRFLLRGWCAAASTAGPSRNPWWRNVVQCRAELSNWLGKDRCTNTPEVADAVELTKLASLSAYFHVHVVLLAIIDKRDGLGGALRAIEDNARHGFTTLFAYADVVERLA